jgi:osmotically-inducible protein OsmY
MIKVYLVTIILVISLVLQGCSSVAMSGAQAVYNRQSLQKSFSDQYITVQAYRALHRGPSPFKDANISVATLNGEVLLAGQTPSEIQRLRAEFLIRRISNVEDVHNVISIAGPSSALKRASDAWITTKVKAKMIASNDLDATQIKVVTENGTVYLMGLLRPSEARAAIDIASETDGVEKVVKFFSYMRISRS